MPKRKFLCNERGEVCPPRDIYFSRPGYTEYELDVPEGMVVEIILDGKPVDRSGKPLHVPKKAKTVKEPPAKKRASANTVRHPKANEKAKPKKPPHPDHAANPGSVEDLLDGLDG